MLFDLRGRHRRRLVRMIYTGLALLMGVGLVGFGVGGGFSGGGILNAAGSGEGGGGSTFAGQIKKYTKITNTQPNNVSAWENLTKALLHEAGQEGYVTSTGYTTKTFTAITAGTAYSVELGNYGSCTFSHWQDGSTSIIRAFTATASPETFTAVYTCT